MSRKSQLFYIYRYNIIEGEQLELSFDSHGHNKENYINNIILNLSRNRKTKWSYKGHEYIFYGWGNDKSLIIGKLAKQHDEEVLTEGETDIEERLLHALKFVYIIIDLTSQIFLIENKTSVFNETDVPSRIFEHFLQSMATNLNYSIIIEPFVHEKKFWESVSEENKVFKVDFCLSGENMPGSIGGYTKYVMQLLNEETRNDSLKLSLRNANGLLKITRKIFTELLDYIKGARGSYKVKYQTPDGETRWLCSEKEKQTMSIMGADSNFTNPTDINVIEDKIRKLHKDNEYKEKY